MSKTTIRQASATYESKETKNITEVGVFDIDLELEEVTYNEGQEDEFTVNETEINGETYRVPNSVLKQIKVLIGDNPNLKQVKVLKEGEGMKTKYQVVPQ